MALELIKTLDTRPEQDKAAMLDLLAVTTERVQKGEIVRILLISATKDSYEYTRLNCPSAEAIGMHTRAIHDIQKWWDAQ